MLASKITFGFVLGYALSGCTVVSDFFGDDKAGDDVVAEAEKNEKAEKGDKTAKKTGKATAKEEQELKIARIWARVDELEEEQLRNKERIRVLEKGMTLGLMPEELKKKAGPIVKEPMYEEKAAKPPENLSAKGDKEPGADAPPGGMSKADTEAYQGALATAHDLYRSGRYGRAIVEYDKIGKDFAGKVEGGMHKYWIGKSWANLKEYNTARQVLVDFVTENASSPWIPRAKLELGRVEWKLGLQDTSLQRFKEIIQAYPYEDAAEMAKMELENLGKTL